MATIKATLVSNLPSPPKYIPRPNASMSLFGKPNDIHLADILYLPHDKFKKKVYEYALNIVDIIIYLSFLNCD